MVLSVAAPVAPGVPDAEVHRRSSPSRATHYIYLYAVVPYGRRLCPRWRGSPKLSPDPVHRQDRTLAMQRVLHLSAQGQTHRHPSESRLRVDREYRYITSSRTSVCLLYPLTCTRLEFSCVLAPDLPERFARKVIRWRIDDGLVRSNRSPRRDTLPRAHIHSTPCYILPLWYE